MKHLMQEEERQNKRVWKYLFSSKTIVRIFKPGDWNSNVPSGSNFLQEVDTSIGMTHTVVERLIDSFQEASSTTGKKYHGNAKCLLASLFQIPNADGMILLAAFEAIFNSFGPVRYMQTEMDSQQKPIYTLYFHRVKY